MRRIKKVFRVWSEQRLREERCRTRESTCRVDAKPAFVLKFKTDNLNLFRHSIGHQRRPKSII